MKRLRMRQVYVAIITCREILLQAAKLVGPTRIGVGPSPAISTPGQLDRNRQFHAITAYHPRNDIGNIVPKREWGMSAFFVRVRRLCVCLQ
jgi:hypothetical protein